HHIAACIKKPSTALQSTTRKLMSMESNGKGFIFDYIYDICRRSDSANLSKLYSQLPPVSHDEKSFIFHLMKIFVRNDQSIKTKRERTDAILKIFRAEQHASANETSGLVVIGKVDDLDFSGVIFKNSKFIDVTFSNCSANEETKFQNCAFSGEIEFVNCNQSEWSDVVVSTGCTFHPPANLMWENFIGSSLGSRGDHIKDAMGLAL